MAALRQQRNADRRRALISVLATRRVRAAVPVLLKEAVSDDASLRSSAMSALSEIAEPDDIPSLIPGLLKAEQGAERANAERTILTVAERIPEPEKRPDAILAAVTPENKPALLPLLGGMGGPKTLGLARAALASSSPDLYEAGVLALCNWPDPGVSSDLLKLATGARKPALRGLAFRNLIRVNSIQSDRHPTAFRLGMLKQAMKLADSVQEKRTVLAGLSTVKDIQTLRYVLPYLKEEGLAQAACRTVVELAHSRDLRRPNQKEFVRALDQVIAICRDGGLIERAKKYKDDV